MQRIPSHLSMLNQPDYLRHLRAQIKPGRQSDSDYRHIDQAAHWRSQYTDTRDALERQQEISSGLQQQVNVLQQQLATMGASSSASNKSTGKRKAISVSPAPSKRVKKYGHIVSIVPDSFSIDFDALDVDQPGKPIFPSFFH